MAKKKKAVVVADYAQALAILQERDTQAQAAAYAALWDETALFVSISDIEQRVDVLENAEIIKDMLLALRAERKTLNDAMREHDKAIEQIKSNEKALREGLWVSISTSQVICSLQSRIASLTIPTNGLSLKVVGVAEQLFLEKVKPLQEAAIAEARAHNDAIDALLVSYAAKNDEINALSAEYKALVGEDDRCPVTGAPVLSN